MLEAQSPRARRARRDPTWWARGRTRRRRRRARVSTAASQRVGGEAGDRDPRPVAHRVAHDLHVRVRVVAQPRLGVVAERVPDARRQVRRLGAAGGVPRVADLRERGGHGVAVAVHRPRAVDAVGPVRGAGDRLRAHHAGDHAAWTALHRCAGRPGRRPRTVARRPRCAACARPARPSAATGGRTTRRWRGSRARARRRPTPTVSRPSDSTSTEASCFATATSSWAGRITIVVQSRTRSVSAAAAARSTVQSWLV